MLEKLFGRLMFGFTDCPNCTCRQAVLWRGRFKLERCLCCGRIFRVKKDNFQESSVEEAIKDRLAEASP